MGRDTRAADLLHRSAYDQIGFTQVHNLVLFDPGLSAGARLLYGVLRSYAGAGRPAWPGLERLQTILGYGETKVRGFLKELSGKGVVSVERRGLGLTNRYWLEPVDQAYDKANVKEFWARKANASVQVQQSSDPHTSEDPDPYTCEDPDPHTSKAKVHLDVSRSSVSTSSFGAGAGAPGSKNGASHKVSGAAERSSKIIPPDDAPRHPPAPGSLRNRLQEAISARPTLNKKGPLRQPRVKRGRKKARANKDAENSASVADRSAHSLPERALRNKPPAPPAKEGDPFIRFAEAAADARRVKRHGAIKHPKRWSGKDLTDYFNDLVETYMETDRPSVTANVKNKAKKIIENLDGEKAVEIVNFFIENWSEVQQRCKIDTPRPTIPILLGYLDHIRAIKARERTQVTGTHRGGNADDYQSGDKQGIADW